ncbi:MULTISPECIES: hypothetical protein [unclassified Sphingopyxis]|uniref:hypothetical protein n=1 Tax=unclassified Sphingopyxis TaxID=2614943 RepID=UPI000A5674FA|nr:MULTISPECIES: hypothetical protein [unclassified Sphingopyxis]
MTDEKRPVFLTDGYVPLKKGYTPNPNAVQGGYVPTTGQVAAPPPKGGSAVTPPPPPKK